MPKKLTLGNDNILINLDDFGQPKDFFFPYIGLENHIGPNSFHRLGIFSDGQISWLGDSHWDMNIDCEPDTFAGRISAENKEHNIKLKISDAVYNEKNIFIRQIRLKNDSSAPRRLKIFFSQQFKIAESSAAHTAYYDPRRKVIIHYRNQRTFLVNAMMDGRQFCDFTTGVYGSEGKEGSHLDAVDGILSKNPIEHGQVDSVIGLEDEFAPGEEKYINYWLAVGYSIKEVMSLDEYVVGKGPAYLLKTTQDFWRAWVKRQNFNFHGLSQRVVDLFQKSLFYIRAHVDMDGAIIASTDSAMLQQGKDTYAYMWPRDAAHAANALNRAGDLTVAKRFFEFCNEVISDEGYFMHKYSPDKSLGSSWHPWLYEGKVQLPIQEDETATVIFALWNYYCVSKDLEFIERIYNSLIKKAANFMVTYRDEVTGLPKPSYDLWEEKFGIHTYTVASVYGALIAASKFAEILGKVKSHAVYLEIAEQIREATYKHLYDPQSGFFLKSVNFNREGKIEDRTADMSTFYGLFNFGFLSPDDRRLAHLFHQMEERVVNKTAIGGYCRYEGDNYYRQSHNHPSNPWVITTLWVAQYYITIAKNEEDLEKVKEILEWVVRHALPSGVLPEQIDSKDGQHLSTAPLTWSHSEFVNTVIRYLDKLEEFGICEACNPVY
ncbi:MAG TPA: glycoside hydrolase family 15 protein [Candidatus Vogelbacteria bacterium]|nr:glycoside hydrolase family 15 protein [Candidatus Vogelbacteria bacterium]